MNKQFLTALSDNWGVVILAIFIMFAVAVANMHKKVETNPNAPITESGIFQVLAIWPDKSCADIDLWMLAPGDEKPTGFLNRDNRISNLMRDDLGCTNDNSGKNFEIIQTHGLPPGEYIINLHYFRDTGHEGPITVHVIGQVRLKMDMGMMDAFDETITLKATDDEETVIRITFDNNGGIIFKTHLRARIVPPQVHEMSAAG